MIWIYFKSKSWLVFFDTPCTLEISEKSWWYCATTYIKTQCILINHLLVLSFFPIVGFVVEVLKRWISRIIHQCQIVRQSEVPNEINCLQRGFVFSFFLALDGVENKTDNSFVNKSAPTTNYRSKLYSREGKSIST